MVEARVEKEHKTPLSHYEGAAETPSFSPCIGGGPAKEHSLSISTPSSQSSHTTLPLSHAGAEEKEKEIEILEQDRTGSKIWACAVLLADLLLAPRRTSGSATVTESFPPRRSVKGQRICELGAGTGYLGIRLAQAGAQQVLITDLPHNIETIKANVRRTGFEDRTIVRALDWRAFTGSSPASSPHSAQPCAREMAALSPCAKAWIDHPPPFDLVVMTEVLYWPALDIFEEDTLFPLVCTIRFLLQPHGACSPSSHSDPSAPSFTSSRPAALLAYKTRDRDREERFMDLCRPFFSIRVVPREDYAALWIAIEDLEGADLEAADREGEGVKAEREADRLSSLENVNIVELSLLSPPR